MISTSTGSANRLHHDAAFDAAQGNAYPYAREYHISSVRAEPIPLCDFRCVIHGLCCAMSTSKAQSGPPPSVRPARERGQSALAAPMLRLTLRLDVGGHATLGPGKVRVLELIGETGSISAAGRAMSMSYRRAWTLVDSLNASFATPLITAQPGGTGGCGAMLLLLGAEVVRLYRALERLQAVLAAPPACSGPFRVGGPPGRWTQACDAFTRHLGIVGCAFAQCL